MRTPWFLIVLTMALVISACAGAAELSQSPEAATREIMTAIQQQGMSGAAKFTHRDELIRFKATMLDACRRNSAKGDPLLQGIFGKTVTLDTAAAISPEEFMEKFLRVIGVQVKGFTFKSFVVLGTVREGELAHVVTRNEMDAPKGVAVSYINVTSLRPDNGHWKMLLKPEMDNLAGYLIRD